MCYVTRPEPVEHGTSHGDVHADNSPGSGDQESSSRWAFSTCLNIGDSQPFGSQNSSMLMDLDPQDGPNWNDTPSQMSQPSAESQVRSPEDQVLAEAIRRREE